MENLPKRKQNRLQGYDYSQNGYYFVTICTENRMLLLSENRNADIAKAEIKETEKRYNVEISPYVIMPDHIHMVIKLCAAKREEQSPSSTLNDILCTFKSRTAKAINEQDHCRGRKVWQRSYYDRIIRDETDYARVAEYILNNPLYREIAQKQTI